MFRLHTRRVVGALAALTLAATLVTTAVPTAQASDAPDCTQRNTNWAKLLQPQSGQATVNAGPAGTYNLSTGGPVPSVTLSFTGTMDVVIEHSCLKTMSLDVYKDGNPVAIHHKDWTELSCEHAQKTEPVTIGLDGGTYKFWLNGTSCNGLGFKHTPEGGIVGDPPLL